MHPQGGSPFFGVNFLTHGGQNSHEFGQGILTFGRAMHDEPGQRMINVLIEFFCLFFCYF